MSDRDAFERSMASLYDAMLDDTRWPVASALIDEACGLTGNGLVVGDPADSEGWGSSRIAMITGLLPHIRQFVRVRQVLVRASARTRTVTALLDNPRIGVIQLDRRGRIIAVNDRARSILRHGDGLSDRDGMLRARAGADQVRLERLVGGALPNSAAAEVSGSMLLRRSPVLPPFVVHVKPVGVPQPDYGARHVAALLLIVEPGRQHRVESRPGGHDPGADASGESGGGLAGGRQERPRHGRGDDEPVAEHADRGQVLLDGRDRARVGPDVGGHVKRGHRLEAQASRLAPGQKTAPRPSRTPPASSRSRSAPRRNSRNRATASPPRRRSPAAARRPPRLCLSRPMSRRPPAPAPRSFGHLSPTADSPVDELLEPLVVVHERMGQRVQPPHGVLRPVEPHLDPVPINRHSLGQARQLRVEGLGGERHSDPGQPRLPEPGQEPLPAFFFAAEGGPGPVFPELAEEFRPGQRSLVAGHLGPEGLHERRGPGGRDAEELLDVAAGEEGPVELFELADGVGDGEEPPGFGGHPKSRSTRCACTSWDDFQRTYLSAC